MAPAAWIIIGLISGFLAHILAARTGRLVLQRILPHREQSPTVYDD